MRKLASVRIVSKLEPIEGADRIERALIGGWKCVVKKGEFSVGERVIYCEVDSFLPMRGDFEFLRKSSFRKMGEREGFRLRTMKMRGQISQGLVLPLSIIQREVELGEDVSKDLGIVKYEAPVPLSLTGEVVGPFPLEVKKTEEERIQNLANAYESFKDKTFTLTEKMDGTSFTAIFDERLKVCGRNWEYKESASNSYWKIARALKLEEKLSTLGRRLAVQGELLGPKIQGNRYGLEALELFVFNIFDLDAYAYLEKAETRALCKDLALCEVPLVAEMKVPQNIDDILRLAEGKSLLAKNVEREGLVWVHGHGHDRISFKTISNRFLSKHARD